MKGQMKQETHDLINHACNQIVPIINRTQALCFEESEREALMLGIACGVMAMTNGGVKAGRGNRSAPSASSIANHAQEVADILRGIAEREAGEGQKP